jgi:hypothetical protein
LHKAPHARTSTIIIGLIIIIIIITIIIINQGFKAETYLHTSNPRVLRHCIAPDCICLPACLTITTTAIPPRRTRPFNSRHLQQSIPTSFSTSSSY